MSKAINLDDRDTHLESIIKSNLVGFNLSSNDIDSITKNLTADVIHALESYELINKYNEEK